MEESQTKLTELHLDGIADDHEDVEQLYLYVNREFAEEKKTSSSLACWFRFAFHCGR
jgi:hypothetical protein